MILFAFLHSVPTFFGNRTPEVNYNLNITYFLRPTPHFSPSFQKSLPQMVTTIQTKKGKKIKNKEETDE